MKYLSGVALAIAACSWSVVAEAQCKGSACYLAPPPSRLAPVRPTVTVNTGYKSGPGIVAAGGGQNRGIMTGGGSALAKPGAGLVAAGGGNGLSKPGAGLVAAGGGNAMNKPGAGLVSPGGSSFRR